MSQQATQLSVQNPFEIKGILKLVGHVLGIFSQK